MWLIIMKYTGSIFHTIYLVLSLNVVFAPEHNPDGTPSYNGRTLNTFKPFGSADVLKDILKYNANPLWPEQWHINEEIAKMGNKIIEPSMKIALMHFAKIKGENVIFIIVGNSVPNYLHADFGGRFEWNLKTCLDGRTYDYMHPNRRKKSDGDIMASAAAGIIGMGDWNNFCGVGVAPKSTLGAIVININGGSGSPEYLIHSVTKRNSDKLVVFIHAWTLPNFVPITKTVHIQDNRDLLDTFFSKVKPQVIGSGDLGSIGNTCQCNEYANLNSMFVFGSVRYDGFRAEYSETGASIIGVTFSTSSGNEYYNDIVTISNSDEKTCASAPRDTTLVSAAIGGGVIGLLMQHFKNKFSIEPTITDITFLLALSSDTEYLRNKNILWLENGAGLLYSFEGGFGLPNMLRIYHNVLQWSPMKNAIKFRATFHDKLLKWNCNGHPKTGFNKWLGKLEFTPEQGIVCTFEISNDYSQYIIQTFGLHFKARCPRRGSITVYLTSPRGTVSCMLEGRPHDSSNKNYDIFIRTFHFLGEPISGKWTLRVFTYKNPPEFFDTQQVPHTEIIQERRKTDKCNIHITNIKVLVIPRAPSVLILKNKGKSDTDAMNDFLKLKEWVDYRYFTFLQVDFNNPIQKTEAYRRLNYFLERKRT